MSKGDHQQRRQSARARVAAARHAQAERVPGQFLALPYDVIHSAAFRSLSYPARCLLIDIAISAPNGRCTADRNSLKALGWTSNDVISRALADLEDRGLVVRTREARWPRQRAWYAVTWFDLKHIDDLDIDPRRFRRGLYRDYVPDGSATTAVRPSDGPMRPSNGPPRGLMVAPIRPSGGPAGPICRELIGPPDGLNLENAICSGAAGVTGMPVQPSRLSTMLRSRTIAAGLENMRERQRALFNASGVVPRDRSLIGSRLAGPALVCAR
ncbi:hypothetical protein MOJ79_18685 [Calidifontimicrobium sp. SYSU G02091]|uniref:hypothetical protein n=1 Tax=Calidifontimicrobium sp. SYSU G02091 TaxID=2926421 RepID=UPI001F535402|nr:hypothetical protein [Calidifontimicrobium sp. SYSU G02091]MCI1193864.1 hypothetical protein [Calidifontimicrobium sp. SYSU G02091]